MADKIELLAQVRFQVPLAFAALKTTDPTAPTDLIHPLLYRSTTNVQQILKIKFARQNPCKHKQSEKLQQHVLKSIMHAHVATTLPSKSG